MNPNVRYTSLVALLATTGLLAWFVAGARAMPVIERP